MKLDHPNPLEFPSKAPVYELASGAVVHRIYDPNYPPTSFNPNKVPASLGSTAAGGRFSPFVDSAGSRVATLYLGTTPRCALAEAMFRYLPLDRSSDGEMIPLNMVVDPRYALVEIKRPMRLVRLMMPEVARLGGTADNLASASAAQYPVTRIWAKALHGRYTDLDGLAWPCRRLFDDTGPAAISMVLFASRVAPSDLGVPKHGMTLTEDLRADLNDLIERAGVVIAAGLPLLYGAAAGPGRTKSAL